MEKFLIVYGTTDGHTQKVAAHIAQAIRAHGFVAEVRDCDDGQTAINDSYDGFIIGASVHVGKHQPAAAEFIKRNRQLLNSARSVFFSVSLSAASPKQEDQESAQQYVDAFLEETGWTPDVTWCVAGALRYSKYGFLKRLIMKSRAKSGGFSTDTSRDHEYTDWYELDRKVEYFLANAYGPYHHVETAPQ